MLVEERVKPAPVAAGNGLLDFDQLAQRINFQATHKSCESQGFSRAKTIHARWIVVRRGQDSSCRIPVFVRRSQALRNVVGGGAS